MTRKGNSACTLSVVSESETAAISCEEAGTMAKKNAANRKKMVRCMVMMCSNEKPLSPPPPSPLKGKEGVVTNNGKETSGLTSMIDAGEGACAPSYFAGEALSLPVILRARAIALPTRATLTGVRARRPRSQGGLRR